MANNMFPTRLYNDLHNEFNTFDVPTLPGESTTTLLLAGDIYDRKHLMQWLHPLSKRFKSIVLVLGNHDYWKGDYHIIPVMITEYLQTNNITNIHYLHNNHIVIDDYLFFGGTMWTDYNNQDPITLMSYGPFHDYKMIRTHNYKKRFTPQFALNDHIRFKSELTNILRTPEYRTKKVIVVSHHAPCSLSIDKRYIDQRVHNGYYYSDMSDLILDHPQIKLWHHGHVHQAFDYMLGGTRIICNPRGYLPIDPVAPFDSNLTIDLDLL